jgi:hypothetical protein
VLQDVLALIEGPSRKFTYHLKAIEALEVTL